MMPIYHIFSSPSRGRSFLLITAIIFTLFIVLLSSIYYFVLDLPAWELLGHILVTVVSGAISAVVSFAYLQFFSTPPDPTPVRTELASEGISKTLTEMAEGTSEYRLFVRTGRHFRADVLPVLTKNATRNRREVTIEAILLDFRNDHICEKYASYRRSASFDRKLWDRKYVQVEILATIFKLIQTVKEHPSLIRLNLYLSTRLSTFRFDASHDQILVTREDPTDSALRYRSSENEFSAFMNEFNWARDAAFPIRGVTVTDSTKTTIQNIFGDCPIISELEEKALEAINEPSPYVR